MATCKFHKNDRVRFVGLDPNHGDDLIGPFESETDDHLDQLVGARGVVTAADLKNITDPEGPGPDYDGEVPMYSVALDSAPGEEGCFYETELEAVV